MSPEELRARGTAIPSLRYRDAQSSIEWLCEVLGFKKQLVVPSEEGDIVHAQLTLGNGMVTLGCGGDHKGNFWSFGSYDPWVEIDAS